MKKTNEVCDRVISVIDNALMQFSNCPVYLIGDFNRLNVTTFESNFSSRSVVTLPTIKDATLDLILIPEEFLFFYHPCEVSHPLGASDYDIDHIRPEKNMLFETMSKLGIFANPTQSKLSSMLT